MFCIIWILVIGHSFVECAWSSQSCLVSEWSEWARYGNGTWARSRVILRYPTGSGTPCPPLTETKVDCEVSEWSDWKQYQQGKISRYRTIIRQLTPQSQCPPLIETFSTVQISTETTTQTAERFTTSFINGGSVQTRLRKRQTAQTAPVRDLLIILDSSGSVPHFHFTTTQQQLGKLLGLLCPIPNPFDDRLSAYQQVALLVYSSSVAEIFDFDTCRSVSAVKDAINKAAYQGGMTCTDLAFLRAINMFTTGKGARVGRNNVKKEVLIISDGSSNCGNARFAAKELKSTGVEVYGLMIGNFDGNGIDEIADFVSYPLGDHLFQLKGFVDFPEFVTEIEAELTANNARCAPCNIG